MTGAVSETLDVARADASRSKPFRSELSPVDFLVRAAYMYPEKVAVVHGERRHSYRQLAERSWRLANAPVGGSPQGGIESPPCCSIPR